MNCWNYCNFLLLDGTGGCITCSTKLPMIPWWYPRSQLWLPTPMLTPYSTHTSEESRPGPRTTTRRKWTLLNTGIVLTEDCYIVLYWPLTDAILGHLFFFITSRQRGYKVGSLMTGPEDPDIYYKQPGHPLHPDTLRNGRSKVCMWCNVEHPSV